MSDLFQDGVRVASATALIFSADRARELRPWGASSAKRRNVGFAEGSFAKPVKDLTF